MTSTEIAKTYTNTFTGTGEPAERFEEYDDAIMLANKEALSYAVALPSVSSIVSIRETIFDTLVATLTGSESVEDAMKKASATVNELLNE